MFLYLLMGNLGGVREHVVEHLCETSCWKEEYPGFGSQFVW